MLQEVCGSDALRDRRIAIQGVGNVGYFVAKYCHEQGATIIAADMSAAATRRVDDEFGAMLSTAVSICGVSAAIAACGAIQGDKKKLSYVTSIVLIVADRSSAYVIAPAIVLASVIAATALTIKFIFPYNKRMEARITDERELQSVLGKWMLLNWIRVSLWTVQWFAIAGYFAFRLR